MQTPANDIASQRRRFRLAIVGAGPNCTYAMERMSTTLASKYPTVPLEVCIFESSGHFGAGRVHSPDQPSTSLLNRVAGQISFAADESNDAEVVLPAHQRPNLHDWCRTKFQETGDPMFDVAAEDWPERRVHGMALAEMFGRYTRRLRRIKGTIVRLHPTLVEDIEHRDGTYYLKSSGKWHPEPFDEVVLSTGHSSQHPKNGREREFQEFAQSSTTACYVPHPYPLTSIPEPAISRDSTVACIGMGVSAIDVYLYLTEGRGGRFQRQADGTLEYKSSGREPKQIIALSRSGLFTFARGFNEKESDFVNLEYKGRFLTESAVNRLRATVGQESTQSNGDLQRQLDFERHILPLIQVEMCLVYYNALLGPKFGGVATDLVASDVEQFLDGKVELVGEDTAFLCRHADALAVKAFRALEKLACGEFLPQTSCLDLNEIADFFCRTLQRKRNGESKRDSLAKSRQFIETWFAKDPELFSKYAYSFLSIANPLPDHAHESPYKYATALQDFLKEDILDAIHGNVANPRKAACDAVWRDLRPVLAFAADLGGLTARSHEHFLKEYMRIHNRLANGVCHESMEKILALARAGVIDLSTGPNPEYSGSADGTQFRVVGRLTGATHFADTIIEARLYPLDVRRDSSRLMRNLLKRGIVTTWRNYSADDSFFVPGGPDLSADLHPIDSNGVEHRNLTFLGPPTEGALFFQIGAVRPNRNHHVMKDVIRWFDAFEDKICRHISVCERLASLTVNRKRSVAAVILAAGANSRMNECGQIPKAMLKLSDCPNTESFLTRHIRLLKQYGVKRIFVVANRRNSAHFESINDPLMTVVVNPLDPVECGSAASMGVGISAAVRMVPEADLLLLDADIVYEQTVMKMIVEDSDKSKIFVTPNVNDNGEEVLVYADSLGVPLTIGKSLPTELLQSMNCLGESLGILRLRADDLPIILAMTQWAVSQRRLQLVEHEDIWQILFAQGFISACVIPGTLDFRECDDDEDFLQIRSSVYPSILEKDRRAETALKQRGKLEGRETAAPHN